MENVFQDGPHLVAAFFCEHLIEEKDGVKSAIRIIDRLVINARGTEEALSADLQKLPPAYPVQFFLQFKNGDEGAGHQRRLKLALTGPTEDRTLVQQDLNFAGAPGQGIDIKSQLALPSRRQGTYWIEVYLDDIRITRVPFTVIILTQTLGEEKESKPQ